MKFPKTIHEYHAVEIGGQGIWKVVRYTYVQTSIDPKTKLVIKKATILKRVGKNIAEEYVYNKDRGL